MFVVRWKTVLCVLPLIGGALSNVNLIYDAAKIAGSPHPIQNDATIHAPARQAMNLQLTLMMGEIAKAVGTNVPAKTEALKGIHLVFGDKADVPAIHTMATALTTHNIPIIGDNVPLPASDTSYGKTLGGDIILSTHFHDPAITEVQRARVLIHENTHALPAPHTTYDWWGVKNDFIYPITQEMLQEDARIQAHQTAGNTLTPQEQQKLHPARVNGYWHREYDGLKGVMSNKMHLNADTWAVYAYYCRFKKLPTAGQAVWT